MKKASIKLCTVLANVFFISDCLYFMFYCDIYLIFRLLIELFSVYLLWKFKRNFMSEKELLESIEDSLKTIMRLSLISFGLYLATLTYPIIKAIF